MSTARPLRVLIVDDSITVRGHISDLLKADVTGFEVIGEAGDGRAAIEMCERLRPDVITMDMMLPVMSGVSATEWIMSYCPTPILVVSSSMNRGEVFRTYDAIAAGAVDVFSKPSATATDAESRDWGERLKSTLRMVARIKVITHPRRRLAEISSSSSLLERSPPPSPSSSASTSARTVIAIGASTGGPGAVRQLLLDLPSDINVPILVVLHVGEPFDATLADWLDAQSKHRVRFAKDGQPLFVADNHRHPQHHRHAPAAAAPGVIMSPGGKHLIVRDGKLWIDDGPERHSCKPSIDVLFESLARETAEHTAAALLTGMGRDGAEGLLAIRRAGGHTIAQDEASSVVYGMPKVAAEMGAATQILPLDRIAGSLDHAVRAGAAR
jgi:two-component system, chemotaxis family, protein-glutamate methylesterase/glutaminase